ncbi:hypothetical protein GOBAR_DD19993 [Gossypium barbadense]|nr:hypothetical protein GOBAR_DD19993 [Gossypium barbadense]
MELVMITIWMLNAMLESGDDTFNMDFDKMFNIWKVANCLDVEQPVVILPRVLATLLFSQSLGTSSQVIRNSFLAVAMDTHVLSEPMADQSPVDQTPPSSGMQSLSVDSQPPSSSSTLCFEPSGRMHIALSSYIDFSVDVGIESQN